MDQLALLGEFDGDEDATDQILQAFTHGFTTEYVAERVRQDRAEQAEHERLRAEFDAAETPVTTEMPDGAMRLSDLQHDGEDLAAEAHGSCPGRGVYFPSWSRTQPIHYCTSPAEHGHTSRYADLTSAENRGESAEPSADVGTSESINSDPDRRLVIEGNKAWAAAFEVRKRWLAQLFARRTAPKEVARFVTEQLLAMPEPLRHGLAGAPATALFTQLTGQPAHVLRERLETCPAPRWPLLMLAPVAVAYESEMFGVDAHRRATWREDRYSPCPRRDAGNYLAFLASLGYQLAPIEQAIADGLPYTGDNPAVPLNEASADEAPASEPSTDAPAEAESSNSDAASPAE